MAMPKLWTWMLMLVCSASAVIVVNHITEPQRLSAMAGGSLSEPIYPATGDQRKGSLQNRIGWTHAKRRYAADMPIGRGIIAGQVEAMFQGGFMGKTGGRLPATGFVSESGISAVSGHAVNVAAQAFGLDSAGMGVREVRAWHVNDWLSSNFLKTGQVDPPLNHEARVYNHSWIGSATQATPQVLRRVDYLVDTYDKIVVCGVGNGKGAIPALLGSAYNVISVGKESGQNSDGLTTIEGEGRCKPEIVAQAGTTSGATGIVTGCVAALLELADRKAAEGAEEGQATGGRNKDAAKSEVIKAVLLAGASRWNNWVPPEGEPLDRALGAGLLEFDRALVILDGGHAPPDSQADTRQRYGWSFAQVKPGQSRTYHFTIDRWQQQVGIALTWNRKVQGGTVKIKNEQTGRARNVWNASAYAPDLDLELVRQAQRDAEPEQVAISASKVDNVELIHLQPLEPGRYTLTVRRKADPVELPWDYALAWRIEAPRPEQP